MRLETKRKIAEIEKMPAGQMRLEYARIFGEETRSSNRQWMFRRLAWRLQALDEGDLSQRARKRAQELAREQDIRVIPPAGMNMAAPRDSVDSTLEAPDFVKNSRDPRLPFPGAVLPRVFKGHRYEVTVLSNGFEFNGKVYRSLSAIAHEITGCNWNGYNFFKLTKPRKDHQ